MKPIVALRVLCLLLAIAAPAGADQVVLEPVKDNTIFSESQNLSNGMGVGLFAGRNGAGSTRRALIAFDVAGAIPAGSTITSAQLLLHVTLSHSGSQMMALHRLTADWGEGTSNSTVMGGGMGAQATTGDATWGFRFFNTQSWTTAGGDFIASASATRTVSTSTPTWGSTATMVADVQGWLDSPAGNFGWILRGNESASSTAKRFGSSEASATNRPKLTIDFEPPDGDPTATATATNIATATRTATATLPPPSPTATRTVTAMSTATITVAPTHTATASAVSTATATHTSVASPSITRTSTATATAIVAATQTATASAVNTATVTHTVVATGSITRTSTATATPTTALATATASHTPTVTAPPPSPTPTETPTVVACVGDCNGDGEVGINELILGVSIALGLQPLEECPAFDPSGNGRVDISELIEAVNNSLGGCP